MPPSRPHPLVLAAFSLLLTLPAPAQRIEVAAGAKDRPLAIVEVPWDPQLGSGRLVARGVPARPLQANGNRAWFVETDLKRGQRRVYRFRQDEATVEPSSVEPAAARDLTWPVPLAPGGRLVANYVAGPGQLPRPGIPEVYRRGGYLHPLLTPSGRAVTDDYPPNHIHHHGLWTAWTRTRFGAGEPDFWNMGERKGRVDFEGLQGLERGPVFAGLTAAHVHTSLLPAAPGIALRETWQVRAYAPAEGRPFHLLDVELVQECATNQALELPRYHYGGFGYRGPWAWNGASRARYLDSNGATNRVTAHGTRARWLWLGGQVEGALAGLAMLGHPSNFRAPQPLRVHPDEPFICWAPPQLGDFQIRPGEPYQARYRIVALDGEPDPALLDQLWQDFAEPAQVRRLGDR